MPNTTRYDSKIDTTIVNTSTAETEIAELVMPAGALWKAKTGARFYANGDILNNSGVAATVIFKLKLGSTTVLTSPATSWAASATRRQWRAQVDIVSVAADSQRISGELKVSDADADTWADNSTDGKVYIGKGTAAVDDGASIDVTLLATLGASHASLEITCTQATLELLR